MGRRGPTPHPAATRALRGARTRAHHRDPVPIRDAAPTTRVPAPPRGLVAAERSYWARFAPLLAGAGLLTAADVETLGDFARAAVQVDDRLRRLRAAWGQPVPDTAFIGVLDRQARGWLAQKTKLAAELGLPATARARLGWTGQRAPTAHAPASEAGQVAATPRSKLADLQERAASLRRPLKVD